MGGAPVEQRRFDYVRLLRQVPAITELVQLDAQGREQLKVSRLAMDVVGSGTDHSAEPAFGRRSPRNLVQPGLFPQGIRAVPHHGGGPLRPQRRGHGRRGQPQADLGRDHQIKVGEAGYAFVVDALRAG